MTSPAPLCRSCQSVNLLPMFSLGKMPPVNAFLLQSELKGEQAHPLDLYYCRECNLVQLGEVVAPDKLFSHYLHLSSASQSNIRHLESVAGLIESALGGLASKRVLEIGSNDGTLLSFLRRKGADVLGVDPAENLAAAAAAKGVETISAFFSEDFARSRLALNPPFDAIVSLNVVAHTPDFVSLLKGAGSVMAPGAVWLIEAAYAMDTILQGQFDTIYHEHVYCFSLHSLSHALKRAGLAVTRAEIIPTQGSSLRVFVRRSEENHPADPSVAALLNKEKEQGFTSEAAYREAAHKVESFKKNFLKVVRDQVQKTGPLIGLGAPARGVVIANYCGLDSNLMKYVIDDTPLKQGRLMGGTHAPVKDWMALNGEEKPAFILLSWNYKDEILKKLSRYRPRSPLIIPFPEIRTEISP